jgi:hypothetical protein
MIIRSSRLARFVRILEVYTKQHYNREEPKSLVNDTVRSSRSSSLTRAIYNTHLFVKHIIATSRCRKTEWLICGAHASSVLAARFSLVSIRNVAVESSRLPNVHSTDTSGGRQ